MVDHRYAFAGRHMIVKYITTDGNVIQAQGFYCQNGPYVDDKWNMIMDDGTVGPGPASRSPIYFFPDIACSLSKWYDREIDALRAMRDELNAALDRTIDKLREVNQRLSSLTRED